MLSKLTQDTNTIRKAGTTLKNASYRGKRIWVIVPGERLSNSIDINEIQAACEQDCSQAGKY